MHHAAGCSLCDSGGLLGCPASGRNTMDANAWSSKLTAKTRLSMMQLRDTASFYGRRQIVAFAQLAAFQSRRCRGACQAYHGGDQQPGCGKHFYRGSAEKYIAQVKRGQLRSATKAQTRLRGRKSFDAFTECRLCGCFGIRGLRSRCMHCEALDNCRLHEPL